MGYYVQGPTKGKAMFLVDTHGANNVTLDRPKSFEDIPDDKAMVVVVDNGAFEAAGLCYSASEFEEFTRASDPRNKQYLIMDRATAYELAGYSE